MTWYMILGIVIGSIYAYVLVAGIFCRFFKWAHVFTASLSLTGDEELVGFLWPFVISIGVPIAGGCYLWNFVATPRPAKIKVPKATAKVAK